MDIKIVLAILLIGVLLIFVRYGDMLMKKLKNRK